MKGGKEGTEGTKKREEKKDNTELLLEVPAPVKNENPQAQGWAPETQR